MLLVVLTGMFKDFLILFSIIVIHEIGHMLAAKYYKWKIDKIYIYPFGGCVKFNEMLNKPLKEELHIMINGPLLQMLYFAIIVLLYQLGLLTNNTYYLFKNYHFSLLLFNLLPAIPLDGGRLLNILLCYLTPYKKSMKYTTLISYLVFILVIIFIIINYRNLNLLLMTVFLISKVIIEERNINYLYNRFILERYLNKYNFKKRKIVLNKNSMYKDAKHIIKSKKRYISENEFLQKRFTTKT